MKQRSLEEERKETAKSGMRAMEEQRVPRVSPAVTRRMGVVKGAWKRPLKELPLSQDLTITKVFFSP